MKLTDDNILQANINRTKQYVRDYGGKVSTLPTATSSNVGQIYQYTGSTTPTYTHGYFYECTENNGTYSWVNVPVGEDSGDVSDSTTTITTSTATYPDFSAGETLKVIFGKIKKFLSDLKGNKTDLTNLATVEPTTTASKSYSVDDWLILNGQLYKVTASIPSGGTITIGTNVEPTTVEDGKSSGGGHTILNGSGSAMTQRSKLQFNGATVTDDSANDKTIVTTTPQSMIGDVWILGHAYAVGNYAIDANGLYKNGTAHTSTATNRPSVNQSGYWTLVSVAKELGEKAWTLYGTATDATQRAIELNGVNWTTYKDIKIVFCDGNMFKHSSVVSVKDIIQMRDESWPSGNKRIGVLSNDLITVAFLINAGSSVMTNTKIIVDGGGAITKIGSSNPWIKVYIR